MEGAKIGKVNRNIIAKNIDTDQDVLMSKTEIEKNNERKVELMFMVGFESRPSQNDKLIILPFGKSQKNLVALGGKNNHTPLSVDGERQIRSTNEAGTNIIAKIYLDFQGKIICEATDNIDLKSEATVNIEADTDVDIDADDTVNIDAVNDVVLQSGSDYAVSFNSLESFIATLQNLFNAFLQNTYNAHIHTVEGFDTSGPNPTTGTVSFDISGAKVLNVRVP